MTQPSIMKTEGFNSFAEFYPFYLGEHSHPVCRALHYFGSIAALSLLIYLLISAQYALLPLVLVAGYGPAWIGHFFIEHNRPATFKYPLWSFMGDWVMLADFLRGRLRQRMPR
jgi:hypothetical protein